MYGCDLGRDFRECGLCENGLQCIDCENVVEIPSLDFKDQDAVAAEELCQKCFDEHGADEVLPCEAGDRPCYHLLKPVAGGVK